MGAYSSAVIADGPKMWWRLTEPPGGTAVWVQPWWAVVADAATALLNDSCGSCPAKLYGGATLGQTGPTGILCETGCSFNGSSGYALAPYVQGFPIWPSETFSTISTLSVELWFKRNSGASTCILAANSNPASTHQGWLVGLTSGTTPIFTVGYGSTSASVSASAIADNNWHHLVATFNAAASTGIIYVDGTAHSGSLGVTTSMAAPTTNLTIAALPAAPPTSQFFNGSLAHVALYGQVLSSTRVLAHFNATKIPHQQQWPTVQTLIAFKNAPLDDPRHFMTVAPGTLGADWQWTDVSAYHKAYSTTRGRQYETDQFNAGQLTVTLDNNTGNFNIWNSSGPYFGFLLPKVWIRVTANGIPRFTGQVSEWDPQWPDPFTQDMQVQAYDPLRFANAANQAGGLYFQAATEGFSEGADLLGYFRCDETGGSISFDQSGNSMASSYVGGVTFNQAGGMDADIDSSVLCNLGGLTVPQAFAVGVAGTASEMAGAWFNLTALPASGSNGVMPLVTLSNLAGLYMDENGFARFSVFGLIVSTGDFTPPLTFSTGQWYYFGLVHDLSSNAGTYGSFYAVIGMPLIVEGNGVTMASPVFSSSSSWTTPPSNQVIFGGVVDAVLGGILVGQGYQGFIDEVTMVSLPSASTAMPAVVQGAVVAQQGFLPQQTTGQRVVSAVAISGGQVTLMQLPDAGTTEVAAGFGTDLTQTTLLSGLQECEATEGGALFGDANGVIDFFGRQRLYQLALGTTGQVVVTFGDNVSTGEVPFVVPPTIAEDDLRIFNDASSAGSDGVTQRVTNPASIAQFGRSTWQPAASLLTLNDSDVINQLEWVTQRYAEPQVRISSFSVELHGMINDPVQASNINAVLAADLVSPCVLNRHSLSFSQPAVIEQITETVSPQGWTINFAIAPADPLPYATWGSGEWGTSVWAY